ncbi:hypothetical protein MRB53_028797 [Persea americana]|uniref:Uncharacterized protein n=1 Tax=Persea americana TaxID=3435 RepID=A0ACC2KGY0_PERAE|nr:hypothetical protein MRB53_028797 [Persea americana]
MGTNGRKATNFLKKNTLFPALKILKNGIEDFWALASHVDLSLQIALAISSSRSLLGSKPLVSLQTNTNTPHQYLSWDWGF